MILILTRENSTYDSDTKTFWFNLDKQLAENVKHLRFQSVSFQPSTVSSYPHGVLVCSRTLTNLSLKQHVNVLRAQGHRNDTDVVACLHKENHNDKHVLYSLAAPLTLSLDRRSFVNRIDIYFTDMEGNKLDGDYVAQSTAGPQLSDLETMHNSGSGTLKIFCDADLASSFVAQDDTEAEDGDTVKQWKARYPSDESVVFTQSSVDGIILTTFDDEPHLKAVTQNDSGGSYEYLLDTDVGFDIGDTGSYYILWETDDSLLAYERIVKQPHFFDFVLHNGNLSLRSGNGGAQSPVIYNIQTNTSYLLEVKWDKGSASGGNHDVATTVNATKLDINGNTEYTGSATTSMRSNGNKRHLYLSDAQTGMDSKVSSFILLHGDSSTDRNNCKDYLIKRWKNQSTTPQVDPNAVSSSWLAEIRY